MNPDTSNLRLTNITLVIFARFFVGLRFLSRWKKRAYIGIDDCFILLAYAALLSLLSAGLLSKDQLPVSEREILITEGFAVIYYGLGVHADGLLAFECIYVTTVALTKVSLLLMYYCIFPINTWNLTIPGHYINLKGSFIGNVVPNILIDVAILGLLMPHVCQLSAMFLLGSFVVFTSIYCFTTLFEFVPSDFTGTLVKACTWVIVESSAGIISACLLTLAPLLRSINFLPWRKNKSSSTPRSVNGVITIGGSGGSKGTKHLRFERLDENLATIVHHSNGRTWGDAESQGSGDEILLKGI
ncbi:hypothetical protein DL95DRAFT_399569 [Leptodontidium sp. 2 PMI_412]|nr:hypothetical protein DL95DRAFT_399569 [Leptodontidium sp. 2 PMI_412]